MPDSELIALIDLDGTLADYDGAMRKDMASVADPDDPPYNPREKDMPWVEARAELIKKQPGWWYNLEPIYHNMSVVYIMMNLGFTVHILTQGPKTKSKAWEEKVEWTRKYLPDVDITITRDKGLVYGKVLFDDYKPYLERWLQWRPRGLAIQPTLYLNPEEKLIHPNCVGYDGKRSDDLIRITETLKRVKDGQWPDPDWSSQC